MKLLLAPLALITISLAAACGGDASPTPIATPGGTLLTGTISVFAASSLTSAFTQIGKDFEAVHPDAKIIFNFAGSQELRVQLEQGADAGVFASADTAQMDTARASGVVTGAAKVFAQNRLVIIVPKNNEADIGKAQDLAKSGVKIVLADDAVPVGKYARRFLEAAAADAAYDAGYKDAVLANVVSEASNVKEVASAVQLDEADAGIVYFTDAKGIQDDVETIGIPEAVNQNAIYPISLVTTGATNATAKGFIEYVLSAEGQATLESFGFIKGGQ